MKSIHDDVDNVGVYDTMYQTCSWLINVFVKKKLVVQVKL
jgi:hypothetical protein